MSIFKDLLAIKRFREGQAEMAVSRQRNAHAEAERRHETAQEQLSGFQDWAQRHESEMYHDLCSRVVLVRDIEDVMQGVADLRAGERERENHVENAAEQVRSEAQALVLRREEHRTATRMTEKFVELASVHMADQMRELERKEDLEMEEAATVTRDRNDWEQHEEYEPS
jgi:type III secretion protein O